MDHGDNVSESHSLPPFHTGLLRYTLQQLRIATDNFSSGHEIGRSSFATVFRGEIDCRTVAVKRFVARSPSDEDFVREINALSRIHHRNIISLIGFCTSKDERLLVFEFAENKSLDYHLYESGKGERLDWKTRRKIALGTARALAYLHHDCEPRIVHRDIKPSNILLNSEFEAKVCGYDIAKLYPDSATHITTFLAGTMGYVDPLYLISGSLTSKADVYSFGVMMLVMITGLKPTELLEVTKKLKEILKEKKFNDLVGHHVLEDYDHDDVKCMVACATISICYQREDRPTMKQIVRVLEGYDPPDSFIAQAIVSRLGYDESPWKFLPAYEQDDWASPSASSICADQESESIYQTQISLPKDFVVQPVKYTLQQLETATVNFSADQVIGRGGFATVYKGHLGGRTIAIKKFVDEGENGDQAFRTEFNAIIQVSHGNLISLVGYCIDGDARLLVFEFAANGSLKDQLNADKKRNLDWETRKKIVLGVARGLAYLHHSCIPAIIHRDIKPENILLDSEFEAKVSDFGIAKPYPNAFATHILTDIRGSPGYIDPHYVNSSKLTSKSDVYSFGILLLGLIIGREPFKEFEVWRSKLQAALIQEKFDDLADEYLHNAYDDSGMICMAACAAVSILPTPHDRPTMQEILNVLQGYSPPNNFIKKLSRKVKLHVKQEITSKPRSNEEVTIDLPYSLNDQNISFPPSPRSQESNAPLRYPVENPTLWTGLYPRQDSHEEEIVTIDVSYGEDNKSFDISISSGLIELKEEIAKRFKLDRSTFNVKYLENKEKEILIVSDADLRKYWEDNLESCGRGVFRLFVEDVIIDLASSTVFFEMKTQQVDSRDPEQQIPDETKTFCNTGIRLVKVVFKIVPLCRRATSSVKEKIKSSKCSRKSSVLKRKRTDGSLEVIPTETTGSAKIESPSILLEHRLDSEQSKDKESNVEKSAVSIIDPFFPASESASTSEAVEVDSLMQQQRSEPLVSGMASSLLRSTSVVIPSLRIKSSEQIEMTSTGTADVPSQEIEIGFTSLKSDKISGSRDVLTQVEEVRHTDAKDQKRSVDYTLSPSVPLFSSFPLEREKVNEENQTGRGQQSVERGTNLKSRIQNAIEMVLQMITNVTTRVVGIYGNGGVGKTTMLKSLITNPTTARTFDLIVFVTVSRCWNVRKLQNEIARHLQFPLDELETEIQNADKLFRALKGLKFLLILDDVWDMIDLDAVGIPDPHTEVGCKIVIASRSWNVCCHMLADKEVEMEGISKEEAWELFHKQLGGIIDFPEFQILAEAIVEECGGSPLTVIVTARALRGENDVRVWRHALEELIRPRKLGLHYTEGVLSQLKFSYERLKVHEKNLFLYCALLPEDEEVNMCQLVDCCMEEGLLVGSTVDLHKQGHAIVERLIDAAFFEVFEDGVSLKMHNTIRDLASWILSPNVEGCQFLLQTDLRLMRTADEGSSSSSFPLAANTFLFPVNSEILLRAGSRRNKPLTEEEWRKAKMIYLMDSEVSTLPASPISPNLVALFLQRNHLVRVISTSFFNHMPSLQILNLSQTRIKSLPRSFFTLLSLRALILRGCERFFVLPAEIGCLKNLEILDLQGTNIMNLPTEICELSRLKHFQVSFYGSNYQKEFVKLPAEPMPRNIISRLLALEILGVDLYRGDQRWSKNIPSLIPEVADLAWLTSLTFSFPEVDLLKVFLRSSIAWQSKRLKMFNFVIGHDAERIVNRVSTDGESSYAIQGQSLRFVNGEGVVPDTILEVLERATAFYIDHHLDMCRLSEIGTDKINKLKVCIIRECPKIQTIIESQDVTDAVLPFLERLNIHYLWNLRRIWEGTMPTGSFEQLRILSLHACPKLDFILSSSMLSYLGNLEELIVEDCPFLKEIVTSENEVTNSSDKLVNLKQVTLHYLPELVSIWKGRWPSLERMSFYNCCSLKNIALDSRLKHTLKEIKAEKDWWDELHWDDTALFLHLQEACFVPISNEDVEGNTYCRCSSSAYHKPRD